MARFYGEVSGQARTVATRRGSTGSGMWAHVRGWNVGAYVECATECGIDVVRVWSTGGSNGIGKRVLLAVLRAGEVVRA